MKLIKAVHLNGQDNNKRFWKVPETLENLNIENGDEAIVETRFGLSKVRILKVFETEEAIVCFKNFELQVTQNVVLVQHKNFGDRDFNF